MRPNFGAEWAGSGTRCLRCARWVAPPGRKTRFRLLARLYRVGSMTHWVPPKGFELFSTSLPLSQASPGASALRSATPGAASPAPRSHPSAAIPSVPLPSLARGDARNPDFTGHQAIDSAGTRRGQSAQAAGRTRRSAAGGIRWFQCLRTAVSCRSSQILVGLRETRVGRGGAGPLALTLRRGIISSWATH